MNILRLFPIALVVLAVIAVGTPWTGSSALAQSNPDIVAKSKSMVPAPPWAKGDQVGMANTLGPGT
ncbi:MAG: hypothetical protein QGH73_04555 [Rhodospirillales bacterium]|nr:hypothetical protein [Rhodospirillales bacterium]MDP6840927.1 hypothetical protein [Rhodospirillales bacterium]